MLRRNLIDRNADANVRARRFLRTRTGQNGCIRAGMIPCPVGTGRAILLCQAGDELKLAPMRGQCLHRLVELVIGSLAHRLPQRFVDPIGHVQKGHAQRRATGSRRGSGGSQGMNGKN